MIQDESGELKRIRLFYSPIGAGVMVPNDKPFREDFAKAAEKLALDGYTTETV